MARQVVKKVASCTFDQLRALGSQNLKLGEQVLGSAEPRLFSTGSYGVGYTGKVTIQLPDGSSAYCQATVSLVVIGSKPGESTELKLGDAVE